MGTIEKAAGDERGLIPLVARSLFRSSSLTESLEQVNILETSGCEIFDERKSSLGTREFRKEVWLRGSSANLRSALAA